MDRDVAVPEQFSRGSRALRWGAAAAGVALAAAVVYRLIAPASAAGPSPPEVNLQQAHPDVALTIQLAREEVVSDPESALNWGRYGMCLYAHEFTSAAVTCFEQAERLAPEDYRWPYLQGLCVTFNDPRAGLVGFDRAARLRPDLVFIRLRTAELLLDMDRVPEAQEHIQAALHREPDNARAALAAARAHLRSGDLRESRKWAERSTELAPDVAAAWELLSRVCYAQGDKAAAQRHLETMREIGPGAPTWPDPLYAQVVQMRRDPHWKLVGIQQQRDAGYAPQAVSHLYRLLQESPENVEVRIELIQTLLQFGAIADASEAITEGLERHPQAARLHRLKGTLELQQGNAAAAAEHLRQATALKPDYALAHEQLGRCLLELEDEVAALEAFETAQSLRPDLPGLESTIERLRNRDDESLPLP